MAKRSPAPPAVGQAVPPSPSGTVTSAGPAPPPPHVLALLAASGSAQAAAAAASVAGSVVGRGSSVSSSVRHAPPPPHVLAAMARARAQSAAAPTPAPAPSAAAISPVHRRAATSVALDPLGSLSASPVAAGAAPATVAQGADKAGAFRARLVRFYQRYNAEKIATVEHIIARYAGNEEAVMRALVNKYGSEPPGPSIPEAPSPAPRLASPKAAPKAVPKAADRLAHLRLASSDSDLDGGPKPPAPAPAPAAARSPVAAPAAPEPSSAMQRSATPAQAEVVAEASASATAAASPATPPKSQAKSATPLATPAGRLAHLRIVDSDGDDEPAAAATSAAPDVTETPPAAAPAPARAAAQVPASQEAPAAAASADGQRRRSGGSDSEGAGASTIGSLGRTGALVLEEPPLVRGAASSSASVPHEPKADDAVASRSAGGAGWGASVPVPEQPAVGGEASVIIHPLASGTGGSSGFSAAQHTEVAQAPRPAVGPAELDPPSERPFAVPRQRPLYPAPAPPSRPSGAAGPRPAVPQQPSSISPAPRAPSAGRSRTPVARRLSTTPRREAQWVSPLRDRLHKAAVARAELVDNKRRRSATPHGHSSAVERQRTDPDPIIIDRRSFTPNLRRPTAPPMYKSRPQGFDMSKRPPRTPSVGAASETPQPVHDGQLFTTPTPEIHYRETHRPVGGAPPAQPFERRLPYAKYSTFQSREPGRPSPWAMVPEAHTLFTVPSAARHVEVLLDVPRGPVAAEQQRLACERLSKPRRVAMRRALVDD